MTTNLSRPYLGELTFHSLMANGFEAEIVNKPMLERYFECERLALSPLYILCDDDIILSSETTLKQALRLMESHHEISQLGLGWKPDMTSERQSSWCLGEISPDIWEFDHCGGCVIIRKGTVRDLGLSTAYPQGIGDDKVMGQTARKLGYKVGVAHKLFFHHLSTISTVWGKVA